MILLEHICNSGQAKRRVTKCTTMNLIMENNPLAPHVEQIHDFGKLEDSTLLKDSPLCSQSSQIEPFVQIHQTVLSCVMTPWA